MDKSKIEWTDATWNPIRGCSVVSEGCRNCYAMSVAARFSGKGLPYQGLAYRNESGAHWTGKVSLVEDHLKDPIRWQRPRMIFVNSMSDLFHESIPDEWIDQIFAVMALAPRHIFQVLTKRPERMVEYLNYEYRWAQIEGQCRELTDPREVPALAVPNPRPLPNVWLGGSVEDQKTADERIPLLFYAPAAIRWVSAEPLLGPIELSSYLSECNDRKCTIHDGSCRGLDWLVVGGESGQKARPMHPAWVRDLRGQCKAYGVPFFFKQWGEWRAFEGSVVKADGGFLPDGAFMRNPGLVNGFPKTYSTPTDVRWMERVGKKAAGRLLDGREWSQYPDVALGGA